MYKKITSILILMMLLFLPFKVFAVDYDIINMEIDAHLQEDGQVLVLERYTYSFDGEFGGIIRELIPKKGTEIVELEAYEGNTPLVIETDQSEHRIHRAGNNENITIELSYKINNGVDVYLDVAEFHWPFFDKSNESTYGNLTINVFPPAETDDVIAFGYDEAYQKESVNQGGHVQYLFGEVPSNRNGDIRVAYDATLFGAAPTVSNQPMRVEIEAAQQQLIENELASAERKESLASIGSILLPFCAAIFIFFLLQAWFVAKGKRQALRRELGTEDRIPEQVLSLPATISYTTYHHLSSEAIAAALLDLVRKGHVEKLDHDRFRLVNQNGLMDHEQQLVVWLFGEIGSKDEFSFDDLSVYTTDKKNHEKYQLQQTNWQKAVRDEVKKAKLYEHKGKSRWTMGLISLILLPFIFLFGFNDLGGLFFGSLLLCISLFIFAISYRPKTWEGAKMNLEWKRFKQQYPEMLAADWLKLSADDQMRAFIYGLGINNKNLKKKNESLINAFKQQGSTGWHQSETTYSFDPSWILVATLATSTFQSADKRIGAESGSGGTIGGGGSGAGGGGGGSGAF